MSTPVVAFFNNKGGVGKTSLVYHLAWMFGDLGKKVLAADLDPQANLTSAFLAEERLEELWPESDRHPETLYGAVEPLLRGLGDVVEEPHVEQVDHEAVSLLVGDLALARFEDELSQQWPLAMDGKERAFRVLSAFWRLIQRGARKSNADLALVDLGPNLGAINRAAILSADYLVVPLAPDLFSLQGLKNLGPTLEEWRTGWRGRRDKNPDPELPLPMGRMRPLGYVVLQHAERLNRPVRAYERWVQRIPAVYSEYLMEEILTEPRGFTDDPNCLGLVKHYRSLIPLAQEARKPIFHLKPADGAIGAHFQAAQDAERNFRRLAESIEVRWMAAERDDGEALAT
jgi:cellulose biosynthesis protein BcsQ